RTRAVAPAGLAGVSVVALEEVIYGLRASVHPEPLRHHVEDLLVDVALRGLDLTLWRMRRRKASSTRSAGSRLVEKMISCSKGTSNFLPEARVRKSWRSSSGKIQRLSSSLGLHSWRPKASIRKTPPLALMCSGDW